MVRRRSGVRVPSSALHESPATAGFSRSGPSVRPGKAGAERLVAYVHETIVDQVAWRAGEDIGDT
jgi:hypothetical protein